MLRQTQVRTLAAPQPNFNVTSSQKKHKNDNLCTTFKQGLILLLKKYCALNLYKMLINLK